MPRVPRLRTPLAWAAVFGSALLAVAPAARGEPTKRDWSPFPVGKEFPDFATKDLQGVEFRLSDARKIDRAQALAAVAGEAAKLGKTEAKAETPLADLPGLKGDDGQVDAEKRQAFLQATGKPYGLVAGPETGASWKTLGEVADWVAASAEAPIVLLVWSSKCPTSREYEPRLLDICGRTGARIFPLASSGQGETDEEAKAYLEGVGLPYRVLLDRDQKVCDLLGGLKTPHAFLLDKRNRLRYAGSIDDDPLQEKEEGARNDWLRRAIESVAAGREVDVLMTAPKG